MKTTRTSFIRCAAVMMAALLGAGAASAATSAPFRADVRGTAGAFVATGVEGLGSADGATVTAWDTTALADGWTALTSGTVSTNVLVLNGPAVMGGRLSTNETWGAESQEQCAEYVVRDDVVVPAGITLSVAADTVVKFTEGASIVVEDGGALVADGALLADFADDSVGGDTNMDGDSTTPTTSWPDWLSGGATNLVRISLLDGASSPFPARAYTIGRPLGNLPSPSRQGARFLGWRTAPDGGGEAVTAEMPASATVATLHASWMAYSLEISPASTNLAATAGNCTFSVAANDDWTATADADWITVPVPFGTGNDSVSISVSANLSTSPRTGTVRVTLDEGGIARDFTISQDAMERVSAPVFTPVDGSTFRASAQRVAIRCATSGATIRYTLDGSELTESSALYTSRGFNVFDSTTIRAKAFKDGMLPSDTVAIRLIRLLTLAEALDVPLWTVTTDGDADWVVDAVNALESGGSSARSGAITHEQTTTLRTGVEGSGTLSFKWKASCEDDPDNSWTWDYLVFLADGAELAHIDGQTGWESVSVKLGEGTHALSWTFAKDFMDGDEVGEDCGWVDCLTWTPTVGDAAIPVSWFEDQGLVGTGATAADAADADPDGDGLTTADEYVAGTDPNDPGSAFTAGIEIGADGKPVVTWTPDLLGEREYKVFGKRTLDPAEEWVEITDMDAAGIEAAGYRFFKVKVEMK